MSQTEAQKKAAADKKAADAAKKAAAKPEAEIVKAWEDFTGRKGEFEVRSLKDGNGLETVGVFNKASGSLVAEAVKGEEATLKNCGEPLTVTHRNVEPKKVAIDNSKKKAKKDNQSSRMTPDQKSQPEQ